MIDDSRQGPQSRPVPAPLRFPSAPAALMERATFKTAPFVLGAISAQQIAIGGQLYVGELLAMLMLLPLVWRWHLTKIERRMVLFAALWSTAQLMSNTTIRLRRLRHQRRVCHHRVRRNDLRLRAYFRANHSRLPSFLIGVALGGVIHLAFLPTAYFTENPWKWGLGVGVLSILVIHYSFFLRRKSLVWILVELSAFLLVSLYFDARSLAVLPLLAGMLYARFRSGRGEGLRRVFGGQWGLLWLLPLVLVAAIALNAAATAVFSSGYVLSKSTPTEASKYEGQSQGRTGPSLAVDQRPWYPRRLSWTARGSVTDHGRRPGQIPAKLAELRQSLRVRSVGFVFATDPNSLVPDGSSGVVWGDRRLVLGSRAFHGVQATHCSRRLDCRCTSMSA